MIFRYSGTIAKRDHIQKIEKKLQALLDARPNGMAKAINEIQNNLKENKRKAEALVSALERVGAKHEIIMEQLLELENEGKELEGKLSSLKSQTISSNDVGDVLNEVETFVANFEEDFASATTNLRKLLICRMVLKIDVHPDERKAFCFVHQIPNVNLKMQEIMQRASENEKAPKIGVPFRKAGVAGTGLEPAAFGL